MLKHTPEHSETSKTDKHLMLKHTPEHSESETSTMLNINNNMQDKKNKKTPAQKS